MINVKKVNTVVEKCSKAGKIVVNKAQLDVLNTADTVGLVSDSSTDNGLLNGKGFINLSATKLVNNQFQIRAYVTHKLHMKDAMPYLDVNVQDAYSIVRNRALKEQMKKIKEEMLIKRYNLYKQLFKSQGCSELVQRIATNMALGKENAKVEVLKEIVLNMHVRATENGTYLASGLVDVLIHDGINEAGLIQSDIVLVPQRETNKTVRITDEMFQNESIQKALGKAGCDALHTAVNAWNTTQKENEGNFVKTFEIFNNAMIEAQKENTSRLETLKAIYA